LPGLNYHHGTTTRRRIKNKNLEAIWGGRHTPQVAVCNPGYDEGMERAKVIHGIIATCTLAGSIIGASFILRANPEASHNFSFHAGLTEPAKYTFSGAAIGLVTGVAVDLAVNGRPRIRRQLSLRMLMLVVTALASACAGLISLWQIIYLTL